MVAPKLLHSRRHRLSVASDAQTRGALARRGRRRKLLLLLFGGLALGCATRSTPANTPAEIESLRESRPDQRITELELQWRVMRFAHRFMSDLEDVSRDLVQSASSSAERAELYRLRRTMLVTPLEIAGDPSPQVALLDMVAFVTLSRIVVEEYWQPRALGSRADPMLTAMRRLEADVWSVAATVLTPESQQDLRDLILEWRAEHPNQRTVDHVRLADFIAAADEATLNRTRDLVSQIGDATRTIDETRLAAQQLMLYVREVPRLVRFNLESAFFDIAAGEEFASLRATSESVAAAADGLALAIEELREAPAEVHESLTPLLRELRATLAAGTEFGGSFAGAAQSLDAVLERIYTRPQRPGGRGFDVLDYRATAAEVESAAGELNTLAGSLDSLLQARLETDGPPPTFVEALRQVRQDGELWADHVFRRGVALIAIFLVGLLATGLTYRFVDERLARVRAGRDAA